MAKTPRETPYKPVPPLRQKGQSSPQDSHIKTLQAMELVRARVEGKTVEEAGASLGLTRATAYRRLKWAEENGLLNEMRNIVLSKIVPKALAAYEKALDLVDTTSPEALEVHKVKLTAAKDIAYGAGVLSKDTQKAKQGEDEYSLEWFMSQRNQKGLPDVNAGGVSEVLPPASGPELLTEGAPEEGPGDGEVIEEGGGDGYAVGGRPEEDPHSGGFEF